MEYWEREKGLDREILISAVEDALLSTLVGRWPR